MKIKGKNAISLIVLVITILVLSILATTVIISLSNTNIISEANRTVNKANLVTIKENLIVAEASGILNADDNVWDGSIATSFAGGDGTKNSPYIIEKPSELAYLAQKVNAGEKYSGKYFKLVKSMNMNNLTWTPIAIGTTTRVGKIDSTAQVTFDGIFDGNLCVIQNLNINEPSIYGVGLFGVTNNAVIQNVIVQGKVLGQTHVAGIVGMSRDTKITNCLARVDVIAKDNETSGTGEDAATIVGTVSGSTDISSCVAFGSVVVCNSLGLRGHGKCAGGVVGTTLTGDADNISITDCTNYASVTCEYQQAGGILGGGINVYIFNCENHGMIKCRLYNEDYYDSFDAAGVATGLVGGIVGYGESNISLDGCSNFGDVFAYDNPGGIVGGAIASNLTGCSNYGDVTAEYWNAGGVAGAVQGGTLVISCLNNGEVLSNGTRAGGIAGKAVDADISNCSNLAAVSSLGSSVTFGVAGGIVGFAENVSVTQCLNLGNVQSIENGTENVCGGIVGSDASTTDLNIKYSYDGGIIGNSDIKGRIVGRTSGNMTLSNTYYYANDATVYGIGKSGEEANLADVKNQYEGVDKKFESLESFLNWLE